MSKDYVQVIIMPVTGDPYEEIVPRKGFLEVAQKIVGGYVAATPSTRETDKVLLVNEDAALIGLPRNPRASLHYIHTYIYGPAMLLSAKDWRRV